MDKQWVVIGKHPKMAEALAADTGVSKLIAQLLINRGFDSAAAVKDFLYASDDHDPLGLRGMVRAIVRVNGAIENGQTIAVVGDYDVDGCAGTAILMRGLKAAGAKAMPFLPERSEGYGLSPALVEEAIAAGAQLIVTVDNGIAAHEAIAHAKSLKVDVVVLDHHEPKATLPDALAIVDPRMEDCQYPFKHLCGAAVAYKFLQALQKTQPAIGRVMPAIIQLAALATVADVMPLVGVNRKLVKDGLALMNTSPMPGIAALAAVAKSGTINSRTLAFQIGPRLNAAGRMASPLPAYAILATDDRVVADELAAQLDETNRTRQETEKAIFADIRERFGDNLGGGRVAVLYGEDWHPGVLGIVAGHIAQDTGKPAIVLSRDANDPSLAKGSCRSGENDKFSMIEALDDAKDFMVGYGGHTKAAGVTIKIDQIPYLKEAIENFAIGRIPEHPFPTLVVDTFVVPGDITESLIDEISVLEPFGAGNKAPVFAIKDTDISAATRHEGGDTLVFEAGADVKVRCVGYGFGSYQQNLQAVPRADVAFCPVKQERKGKTEVYARLIDIKSALQNQISVIDRLFWECREENDYKDISRSDEFNSKVVGVTFDRRQETVAKLREGDPLDLVREPHNASGDVNAIRVEKDSAQIGYIRAGIAMELAPLIDKGAFFSAFVSQLTGGTEGKPTRGVNIVVSRADKKIDNNVIDQAARARLKAATPRRLQAAVREALIGAGREYHTVQGEAIAALRKGKSILYVSATGRGKSAVFQSVAAETAIAKEKKTVIAYPLRALTNDQEFRMRDKLSCLGMRILRINGSLEGGDRAEALNTLLSGNWDIALTTPEFLAIHASKFAEVPGISMLVIDEAHHVDDIKSRPAYASLGKVRRQIGAKHVCAVTATADDDTAAKIQSVLGIDTVIIDDHVRDNLVVQDVRGLHPDAKTAYLTGLLLAGDKTLVYVNTRWMAFELAKDLREKVPERSHKIAFYHGALGATWRHEVETMFRRGDVTMVVCTSAFGEGIDISDVRHVVMANVSRCATDFTQQAGRAGRDGVASTIHLMYSEKDAAAVLRMVDKSCPSDDMLRGMYATLKRLAAESKTVEKTNAEIAAAYNEITHTNDASADTVATALAIFSELGLIERESSGRKRTITLTPGAVKVDLSTSAFYQESRAERAACQEFTEKAFKMSAEDARLQVSSPIAPKGYPQTA